MTKTIFRDGTYYRHVWVGKRTVKQGECAAIWTQSGKRKVIEGPQRVRLWFSHVRFLTRRLADSNEYLRIKFRDGNIQHSRGPCSVFIDPCVHESIEVKPAFKLTQNEVLVVYSEREGSGSGDEGKPLADAASARKPDAPAAAPTTGTTSAAESSSPLVIGQPANVIRRVVHGPAVYVPRACEWVHEFSWHAESKADKPRGGGGQSATAPSPSESRTAIDAGRLVPHARKFQTLRCTPDQQYLMICGVRTKDNALVAVHLMVLFDLADVEKMLNSTSDPIADLVNALSADAMTFGANHTYETLLESTEQLSSLATFPAAEKRLTSVGYNLLSVVYRGFSTSPKLQSMHDESIAKRTQLRLSSETARVEQSEAAMMLRCREERSLGEQQLEAAAAAHQLELQTKAAEQKRADHDADHAQALRHQQEAADLRLAIVAREHDEELRRASALKELEVDLTRLLCVTAERPPDQHLRIDSATGTPISVQLERESKAATKRA